MDTPTPVSTYEFYGFDRWADPTDYNHAFVLARAKETAPEAILSVHQTACRMLSFLC